MKSPRLIHRVYGLGLSWDTIPVVTTETMAVYTRWPQPHSEVTKIERCRLVAVIRVTLICVMIRFDVPLWEVSP